MIPSDVHSLAARFQGKLKRSLLRAPLLKQWSEQSYYAALGRHAEQLPYITHYPAALLDTLRRDWVASLPAEQCIPADVHAGALELCSKLAHDSSPRSTVESSMSDIASMRRVYAWGLADYNLDLAESYIGLPVHYLGVSVKREKADARNADVRQWHVDVEDRRMLKLIVYLNPVGDDDGPLEYLERGDTNQAIDQLGYWTGFVGDARMASAVRPERWRRVTGPALTMAVVDTCRLFHRAKPPVTTDRYSMSFSYCSTRPYQLFPEFLPHESLVSALAAQLSPRQRAATIHA